MELLEGKVYHSPRLNKRLTSPDSMNFTKLTHIEWGMAIGYSDDTDESFDPLKWVQDPLMEINFPSLTYSATVKIWVSIARSDYNSTTSLSADIWHSLSFPLLETISGDPTDLRLSRLADGLAIYALGNLVTMDFPKLSNCSSITTFGMISG